VIENKVFGFQFILTDAEKNVIDETSQGQTRYILTGYDDISLGVQELLLKSQSGDLIDAEISPEKAFGVVDSAQVKQLPRTHFVDVDLQEGLQLQGKQEDGSYKYATIVSFDEDLVTVDENHPLAGKTLHCKGEVLSVREPTEQELRFGVVNEFHGMPM
jgi:FKBP-type peptidyl-prolyl cis-trans isomerase SlyD